MFLRYIHSMGLVPESSTPPPNANNEIRTRPSRARFLAFSISSHVSLSVGLQPTWCHLIVSLDLA